MQEIVASSLQPFLDQKNLLFGWSHCAFVFAARAKAWKLNEYNNSLPPLSATLFFPFQEVHVSKKNRRRLFFFFFLFLVCIWTDIFSSFNAQFIGYNACLQDFFLFSQQIFYRVGFCFLFFPLFFLSFSQSLRRRFLHIHSLQRERKKCSSHHILGNINTLHCQTFWHGEKIPFRQKITSQFLSQTYECQEFLSSVGSRCLRGSDLQSWSTQAIH